MNFEIFKLSYNVIFVEIEWIQGSTNYDCWLFQPQPARASLPTTIDNSHRKSWGHSQRMITIHGRATSCAGERNHYLYFYNTNPLHGQSNIVIMKRLESRRDKSMLDLFKTLRIRQNWQLLMVLLKLEPHKFMHQLRRPSSFGPCSKPSIPNPIIILVGEPRRILLLKY